MVGYIYLMTDTTNGMRYTGKHHYDKPELDPNYHGSGTIISKIYKKRPETIKEEYIKTCYSDEEMNSNEKHYIKVFDTLYPNGYNLTEGGDGVVACEETRKKISEANKKRIGEKHKKFSDEVKKKLSEIHKGLQSGNKHPMYGKHLSEESIRKRTEKRTGMFNIKSSKPVLQYTLDGEYICEYPSVMEIKRVLKYGQGNISSCCRGERKSAYGFIWKYKEVS